MKLEKKEQILKTNLTIFEELTEPDINYVLGYIAGLVASKKKEGKLNNELN